MEGEGLNNRSDQKIRSTTFMLDVITSGPQDGAVGGSPPFDSSCDVVEADVASLNTKNTGL